MRKPRAVRSGDRIAVVAPASPFPRDEFERGAAELRRLGYEPVYDDTVFAREGSYLAGSAELRARAFDRYWQDRSVAAVIAARGGFGSVQLLPLLDAAGIAAAPKVFIGYSDNTSILSWLTLQCGMTALHGPMIDGRLAKGSAGYDERSFVSLLGGGAGLELAPDGIEALRGGEVTGLLFGGTITQLAASLGTPYAFNPPAGCVLFLEEVNERPYRLDRLLTQLRLSGILSRARALVFGEMRGCDEPSSTTPPVTARDVVHRLARDFDGPVVIGFPSGHTTGPCWSLPLGVTVRIRSAGRPSLIVEESPVE